MRSHRGMGALALIMVAGLALATGPADARLPRDAQVVVFHGAGSLHVGSNYYPAREVTYMRVASTGRVSFNVATPDGTFGLSGQRDRQPNRATYILDVDSMVHVDANGVSGQYRQAAQGFCQLVFDPQHIKTLSTLNCSARTGVGEVRIDLVARPGGR